MEIDSSPGAASLQAAFTKAVHRYHAELCGRGMNANEACALALRAAAGQVSMPVSLPDIYEAMATAQKTQEYTQLCTLLRTFFGNPDALHASFWPTRTKSSSNERDSVVQTDQDQHHHQQQNGINHQQQDNSSSNNTVQQPQQQQQEQQGQQLTPAWLQIDAAAVQELHERLQAIHADSVRDAVMEGSQVMLLHLSDFGQRNEDNPGFTRQVSALFAIPWLEHWEFHHVIAGLAGTLVKLPQRGVAVAGGVYKVGYWQQLQQLMLSWKAQEMKRVVGLLQQYITLTLYHQQSLTKGIEAATEMLGMVHSANNTSGVLELSDFYNDAVNEPDFNIKEDYRRWTRPGQTFSFCHHPWIYDPASKSRVLQLENQMQQFEAFENTVMRAIMQGSSEVCPFLLLKVRRGPYLLSDTLLQINNAKNNRSLKKPLKVKFVGEEGVDEGGVQKEFFQLLVRQCFNPEFGMFVYSEETHLHWFHASSMDLDTEFELIGILIGLAIYNSHILEFQFPLVLYKKLMGHAVSLSDLQELHPDIYSSLQKLLLMNEDEIQNLALSFQIEAEGGFGEHLQVDLIPNGASVPVTKANVQQYVEQYADHLLVRSIAKQFDAFKRGFDRLCSGAALQFFRPSELEQLVCGGRVVDLNALQAATHYDDGYHERSTAVCWFWEVVHALDDAQQKRLLSFITGSDRVPIKGLGHLSPPFVISRNGSDNSRLPTAHTCFNHLLLPAYKDKETLRQRLLLAIENAEGFGLL